MIGLIIDIRREKKDAKKFSIVEEIHNQESYTQVDFDDSQRRPMRSKAPTNSWYKN